MAAVDMLLTAAAFSAAPPWETPRPSPTGRTQVDATPLLAAIAAASRIPTAHGSRQKASIHARSVETAPRKAARRNKSVFDKTPHIVFCLERRQAPECVSGRAFHPNPVQPRNGAGCASIAHSSPTSYPQVVHFQRLALCLNRHYRVAPAAFYPICWVSKAKQTQTPKKASKIIRSGFYPARARTWRDGSPPQTATLRSPTLILLKPSSSARAKCITLHVVF